MRQFLAAMQVPYRFQAFLSIWDDMKAPCELEQLICLTGQLVAVMESYNNGPDVSHKVHISAYSILSQPLFHVVDAVSPS